MYLLIASLAAASAAEITHGGEAVALPVYTRVMNKSGLGLECEAPTGRSHAPPRTELLLLRAEGGRAFTEVCDLPRDFFAWYPTAEFAGCPALECSFSLEDADLRVTGAQSEDCQALRSARRDAERAALAAVAPLPWLPEHCGFQLVEIFPPGAFPGATSVKSVRSRVGPYRGYLVNGRWVAMESYLNLPARRAVLRVAPGYGLVDASGATFVPPIGGQLFIDVHRSDPPRVERAFERKWTHPMGPDAPVDAGGAVTWRARYGGVVYSSDGQICDYDPAGGYTCAACDAPIEAPPAGDGGAIRGVTVRASSDRLPSSDPCYSYHPENVLDGYLSTTWQESVQGSGEGQWLEFSFRKPTDLAAIEIAPGFQKHASAFGDLFTLNGRPTAVEVQVDAGSPTTWRLEDRPGLQRLDLEIAGARVVRVTLAETAPGSRWADTAISEVRFLAPDE